MKPTRPGAVSPASAIDSFAASCAEALGSPSKPEPGANTFATRSPSASAITVIEKK